MGALFLFWMYLFYTINSSIKWKYVIGFLVFGGLILLCTWMRMGKEDNKDYEKNKYSLIDIIVRWILSNMELEIIIDIKEKIREKIDKIQLIISTSWLFIIGFIGIVSNNTHMSLYAVCLSLLLSIYSLKAKTITEVFFPGVILLMYWLYICAIFKNIKDLSIVVNVFSFLCGIIIAIISMKQNRKQTVKK